MRYLITGGLGVVGSYVADELLAGGDEVLIVDIGSAPRNRWMGDRLLAKHPKLKIWQHRVEEIRFRDPSWAALLEVDAIIHAAAHTGIPHSAEDPGDDWYSNVDATRVLLEALRKLDRKIPTVVMSSVKPYAVGNMDVVEGETRYLMERTEKDGTVFPGIGETWPLEPDEPYAASKMAQSALCVAYARTYDLPVTCLRFSNLYGPAPCHGPRHGWLTWACISKALGLTYEIQGNGLQVRDMLYASDISLALMMALDHIDSLAGQIYNVGGGPSNTISVQEAVALLGLRPRVAMGRKNEDKIFVTNHGKFTRATGWQPRISVPEGVRRIVTWAEENRPALEKIYADVLR